MTYREMQQTIKAYREGGYETPALNSKKEVLENWLALELSKQHEARIYQFCRDDDNDYDPDWQKEAIALSVDAESQPVERVWKLQLMNLAKLRRYAKKQGIKRANQMKKQALIQALTA